MTLTRALGEFLESYRTNRRSQETVRGYHQDLKGLVALATVTNRDNVTAFTPDLVRAYFQSGHDKGLGTKTLMRRRAAVRRFALWGMRAGVWSADPSLACPDYKTPKRQPKPFKPHERGAVMALELPAEERLIRAILYHTGMRAGAVVRIKLGDITLGQRDADGRWIRSGQIRSIGKGNKEVILPVIPELDAILRDYLAGATDKRPAAWLLRRPTGERWSYHMLRTRVARWAEQAGIPRCHAHKFRHTFGTRLAERGVDVRLAQQLMGHEDISTTMQYTEVAQDAVAQAAMMLSDPMLTSGITSESSRQAAPTDA